MKSVVTGISWYRLLKFLYPLDLESSGQYAVTLKSLFLGKTIGKYLICKYCRYSMKPSPSVRQLVDLEMDSFPDSANPWIFFLISYVHCLSSSTLEHHEGADNNRSVQVQGLCWPHQLSKTLIILRHKLGVNASIQCLQMSLSIDRSQIAGGISGT